MGDFLELCLVFPPFRSRALCILHAIRFAYREQAAERQPGDIWLFARGVPSKGQGQSLMQEARSYLST